ncbi:hypothetical protein ABIB24_001741 [Pseudomonas sp. UYEF17]
MAKRYEYSDEVWGVVSELFIKPQLPLAQLLRGV